MGRLSHKDNMLFCKKLIDKLEQENPLAKRSLYKWCLKFGILIASLMIRCFDAKHSSKVEMTAQELLSILKGYQNRISNTNHRIFIPIDEEKFKDEIDDCVYGTAITRAYGGLFIKTRVYKSIELIKNKLDTKGVLKGVLYDQN